MFLEGGGVKKDTPTCFSELVSRGPKAMKGPTKH